MSYKSNPSQQVGLNDRFNNMTETEKKVLMGSWGKDFSDNIFPYICEDRFAVLYSDKKASRPNTPVNIIVGAMIIKEVLGLTDDELREALVCDIRMQYALHTTSYDQQPLSDRTLSRFRERLYEYEMEAGTDLVKEEIVSIAAGISKFMELQPTLKRMDSLMVASACKDMTRLEVVYTVTANLANAVHKACGDELLQSMEHYLNADDEKRVIYHNKPEDRESKIQEIIEDCTLLMERLGEEGAALAEYALAKRMLDDQSEENKSGGRVAKNKHEIAPDSLQNPSDPEATYRNKANKGYKGYAANVVQTFNKDGAAVITDYDFKQNTYSDIEFGKDTIENIGERGEATPDNKVVMVTDGGYYSEENAELAKENNIELIPTALIGEKPPAIFADFTINTKEKQVEKCPAGNTPLKQSYNEKSNTYRTVMCKDQCANCPHKEECNAKIYKKSAVVTVSVKKVERARVNRELTEGVYVEYRNMRNAIEGVQSVLRRKYRVDEVPAYGLIRTKLYFGFKVCAINFKKLMKYTRDKSAHLNDLLAPREQYAQM